MRFISPIPGYNFIAIHEKVEVLASGLPRTLAPGFICRFKVGDTTDWEREYARVHFKFNGVPLSERGQMPIDPVPSRVSSFDTLTIANPKLRKEVEDRLLETQRPSDHMYVEPPAESVTALDEAEHLVSA